MLQVLVVPGVFIATDFADAATISSGGPLGDLVQWADLISALHVLGHNVTLEWDVLRYDKYLWTGIPGCPRTGMDLVFTDIIALKTFPNDVLKKHSCRIRVIDAYGTEAMYNHPKYSLKHGYNSPYYGRLGMDLRQFLTFYPHTPENSFLGFVVSRPMNDSLKVQSNIVLLYGKKAKYFEGVKPFISQMVQLGLEVHATSDNDTVLPRGVHNHGILPFEQYQSLMASAKYFVGLGQPLESTAAVEALANACIFINPRFDKNQSRLLQHMNKPTSRLLESQVTYLTEEVGPPHVYTINISNPFEVSQMFAATKDIKVPSSYIPPVFTMNSFLQRIAITTQNQDLCVTALKRKIWPPVSALVPVYGQPNQSCSDACLSHGLMCEYSFFRDVNTAEVFSDKQLNITCPGEIKSMDGLLYPARLVFRALCALQPEPLLFSCTGRHPDIQRVCPCREFLPEQPSICKQCFR
ncbi:hypothetical protein CAPTEDRAFT_172402 [Capitella teleta]|uniref:alpha-1,6-mannosyl-glycoprotein 6-beta-N-acetylglucosaminyltransferase n=1 Tax=Capitella teleta TaxID=283909 RepID=R7VAM7_CAPTE|nr:hypothetical protein CAPTEDRAFT_172402 [Capitella teleta]|eukprot:ELU15898.1 hypothetical protein CAPTEDRAFT_172402 [Capitella teleta]